MRRPIKANQVWVHPTAFPTSKFFITKIRDGTVYCIKLESNGSERHMPFGLVDRFNDIDLSDGWSYSSVESIVKLREQLLDQQRRHQHADKYL